MQAKVIVTYFNTFPKQHACLSRLMVEEVKSAMTKYKSIAEEDNDLLKKSRALTAITAIGDTMFWKKLELIADLLRPITIEIGIIEARGTSISDVVQCFGRLWAFFETRKLEENRFSFLPGILNDLIQRWEWRMNIYFDVDMLVLAHCLDPALKFDGMYCNALLIEDGEDKKDGKLKQLRCDYLDWISNDDDDSVLEHGIAGWNTNMQFEKSSVLYRVSLHLLSLPAHAADLERIFIENRHQTGTGFGKKGDRKEKIRRITRADMFRVDGTQSATRTTSNETDRAENIGMNPIDEHEHDEKEVDDEDGALNLDIMLTVAEQQLNAEDLPSLAAEVLQTDPSVHAELTDAQIDNMLTDADGCGMGIDIHRRKRRRLPGYRKVTRHFREIFDLETYLSNVAAQPSSASSRLSASASLSSPVRSADDSWMMSAASKTGL
eukprot:IDg11299t1